MSTILGLLIIILIGVVLLGIFAAIAVWAFANPAAAILMIMVLLGMGLIGAAADWFWKRVAP